VQFSSKKNSTNSKMVSLFSTNMSAKDIIIKKKIGQGNFGEVYLGVWKGTQVALKTLQKNRRYFKIVGGNRYCDSIESSSYCTLLWLI